MSPFEKLKAKLAELFQLDQGDLDFGIYRIMNARREEITRFLERDLLPQVREAFSQYQSSDKAEIQKELDQVIEGVRAGGMDPEASPRVRDLRDRLRDEAVDITALENEVYSRLCDFFSRYYDEGDFISLRRYKDGVYAIPYEGEEVKLYWANHDQYYIKTTEHFRDYAFRTGDDHRVHFKIAEADTEKDNVKATNGNDRRFLLHGDNPVVEENGELIVRFEYCPDSEKRKQDAINVETAKQVMEAISGGDLSAWRGRLSSAAPTPKNPNRTLLEKHLYEYTRRNTFDYFIHKDLGTFLRRELDFYIKNEVMYLDDVENESTPRVEQYLSKIVVIRRIAHKIIDFLAQIENFQKKLWLKKKFVVETNYCMTLDRVREEFYPEIAANGGQREEWVRLFAIDEIEQSTTSPAYSEPLTVSFLKAQPRLALDTRFFDDNFRDRLVGTFENLDESITGLLVHGENFQALGLVAQRYRAQVQCVYIDPPYNSDTTAILYKNDYKHSSWLSLMDSRLQLSKQLNTKDGSHVIAIDENEQEVLGRLLGTHFPSRERICVAIVHNKKGIQGDYFSHSHDYAYFCIPLSLPETNGKPVPEADWEYMNLRKWGRESERNTARNCFYPIYVHNGQITGFGDVCDESFHPGSSNLPGSDSNAPIAVYPVDSQGVERKWRYARQSVESIRHLLKVHKTGSGEIQIHKANPQKRFKTVWDDPIYIAGDYGTKWLSDLGLKVSDDLYPKSIHTVEDCVHAVSGQDSVVLDYFAGSGTTAHAVLNLNAKDGGARHYVLVEMGGHFDTVLRPRIQKIMFSREWKDGRPTSGEGHSHMFKYLRLESYEDTLANIRLQREDRQQALLNESDSFRESYLLGYMLDAEAKGSTSLLDLDRFEDPFNYELLIGTGSVGETKPVKVDLVETFNWLLGLRVRHVDHIRGFRVVEGTNPRGEKVLVIWRNLKDTSNDDLDEFFKTQQYNTLDMEFDLVYVNGDNNLMNLPMAPEGPEPPYKVRLIEEEFQRLMFDVKDVE